MAITVTVSPTPAKLYATTTATVAGASATTGYFLSIVDPAGHTKTLNFTTNGAGGATIPIVPSLAGTYTVTMYPQVPASSASASFATGHS